MRLITVVLRPALFDSLKDALALFGVHGMTVSHVYRVDSGTSRVELYRGQRFSTDLEPSVRVDVVAADLETPDLVRVIASIVRAEPFAGQLWTTPVELLARVRTGEYGLDAL